MEFELRLTPNLNTLKQVINISFNSYFVSPDEFHVSAATEEKSLHLFRGYTFIGQSRNRHDS